MPESQLREPESDERTPATLATAPPRAESIVDLLTAAAEFHGAVLLHHNSDFEHIAAVTGQPRVWVVPKGFPH